MENLVSTAWLAGELGKPDLVVLDCSTYLPGEPGDKHGGFRAAHIPGARLFDIDLIADPEDTLPHMVPSAARFAALVGALGVSNASRVVFYDQHGLRSSARGWWMMRLFGHEDAAVLDGGLPVWQREERPIETGDAPRKELPSGHMPGAANLPSSELLGPDLLMKDRATLRAMFEAAGVTQEQPVVTTCGSGVTACALALGMVLAGFPEPAVYDGSWTEWAGRPETPKATHPDRP